MRQGSQRRTARGWRATSAGQRPQVRYVWLTCGPAPRSAPQTRGLLPRFLHRFTEATERRVGLLRRTAAVVDDCAPAVGSRHRPEEERLPADQWQRIRKLRRLRTILPPPDVSDLLLVSFNPACMRQIEGHGIRRDG